VRSVGASASTATGTWDNRRLPHHLKGHLHSTWAPNKARHSPNPNWQSIKTSGVNVYGERDHCRLRDGALLHLAQSNLRYTPPERK
jgi:hypothetical protein